METPAASSTRAAEPEAVYAMEVDTDKAALPVASAPPDSVDDMGLTTGKWDAALFDCFSSVVPNCLMVTFCPCVTLAQIGHRLNVAPFMTILLIGVAIVGLKYVMLILAVENQIAVGTATYEDAYDNYYYYAHRLRSYHSVNIVYRLLALVVEVGVCIFIWHLRHLTRERFRIPGSHCEDCLLSFFCSCCTAAQIATHTKSYQSGSCTITAPDTLPAFK